MASVEPQPHGIPQLRLVDLSVSYAGEIRSITPAQMYWDRFRYWWQESPDAAFLSMLGMWASVVGMEIAALVRSGAFLRFPVMRENRPIYKRPDGSEFRGPSVGEVKTYETGRMRVYRYEASTRPALVPHVSPYVYAPLVRGHGGQIAEGASVRALFVVDEAALPGLTRAVVDDAEYLGMPLSQMSLRSTTLAELARAHPGGIFMEDAMYGLGQRGSLIYAVW